MPIFNQLLEQSMLNGVFLASLILITLVLIGLFLLVKRNNRKLDKNWLDVAQAIEGSSQISVINQQSLIDSISRIESQYANSQKNLYESLTKDRERQATVVSQLRVELEKRFADTSFSLNNNLQEFKHQIVERFEQLKSVSERSQNELKLEVASHLKSFSEQQSNVLAKELARTRELIDQKVRDGLLDLRKDLDRSIKQQNDTLATSIKGLTENTDNRLKEISGQVEKRLAEGFDKTNQTFTDVLKRLALIDDAQKKISELSGNVISLQEILNDKRSRGAFGEVQLNALISNIMPTRHYQIQHKLSNDKIVDCALLLPEPTGKIAIDAKFPLESFRKMTDVSIAESDRKIAKKQFVRDIKKHINDISEKYIIPPETAEGAVMFIPAESVFAEIHGHFPELVELAYSKKVWLVSPTTLMAILTTAAAVIKDEETREQVHIIQEHLNALGKDFIRFQDRMDNLSRHISQVSKDVEQVHVSARKITSRFDKIEKVELNKEVSIDDPILDSGLVRAQPQLEISDS